MTLRSVFDDAFMVDLKALPRDTTEQIYLRIQVRTTAYFLAGDAYLPPSVKVKDSVRAFPLDDQVVLVYRLDTHAVITFLRVLPYAGGEVDVDAVIRSLQN